MHAFGVENLLTDEMRPFLTTVPSGRDDDVAQLAYLARENQEGRSTYLLSNDLFTCVPTCLVHNSFWQGKKSLRLESCVRLIVFLS